MSVVSVLYDVARCRQLSLSNLSVLFLFIFFFFVRIVSSQSIWLFIAVYPPSLSCSFRSQSLVSDLTCLVISGLKSCPISRMTLGFAVYTNGDSEG